MVLDEDVREFLIESNENLANLDRQLVELEERPDDATLLADVFRTVHTIKGTSGFFGFDKLGGITHVAENMLSQLRDRQRELTPQMASLILESVDAVKAILTNIEATGQEGDNAYPDLRQRLEAAYRGETPALAQKSPGVAAAVAAAEPEVPAAAAEPALKAAEALPVEAKAKGEESMPASSTLIRADEVEILGTDLSEQVLDRARQAKYVQFEVNRGLPAALLVKYFRQSGLNWELNESIRKMVSFQTMDLRQNMRGLGPFDLILCRNVLIYFDVETKKKIVDQISRVLQPHGTLVLGCAETIINVHDGFTTESIEGALVYSMKNGGH